MTLPASGAISINAINAEFGRAGTAQTSMSQLYRGGGITTGHNTNVPTSGAISFSQFYGAKWEFEFSIASNQTNANLRTLAIAAGWDELAPLVATINSGIYVSSNSTGTPAMLVSGSFPNGVELVNNGFIVGMGGAGGRGGNQGGTSGGTAGATGGLAFSVASAISVRNNGTIAGGGGGGGGGSGSTSSSTNCYYDPGSKSTICNTTTLYYGGNGGGGGRSSAAANSAGGGAGTGSNGNGTAGQAGTVSAAGNAGGARAGNGGGWGTAGAAGTLGAGAAGAAVSGNTNVTWLATGTRLGAIS
jgi:hypothetical protein